MRGGVIRVKTLGEAPYGALSPLLSDLRLHDDWNHNAIVATFGALAGLGGSGYSLVLTPTAAMRREPTLQNCKSWWLLVSLHEPLIIVIKCSKTELRRPTLRCGGQPCVYCFSEHPPVERNKLGDQSEVGLKRLVADQCAKRPE